MSFKIGFTAEQETPKESNRPNSPKAWQEPKAVRSVVEVFFPERHLTCSYYNDRFNLKRGDMVFVEGKLEGLRGRVVKVNKSFKIKLSDYKRVIGRADTHVEGELFMAGSHFITLNEKVLPYEKVITWFKAPSTEEEELVSSADDEGFFLNDLSGMQTDEVIFERGHEYYRENRVVYVEIKEGKGRAIVMGTKPYEVEFFYDDGRISGLVCDCYCTGTCKHEVAVMLQLCETFRLIDEEYGDGFELDYIAMVSKPVFFECVVDGLKKGSMILD